MVGVCLAGVERLRVQLCCSGFYYSEGQRLTCLLQLTLLVRRRLKTHTQTSNCKKTRAQLYTRRQKLITVFNYLEICQEWQHHLLICRNLHPVILNKNPYNLLDTALTQNWISYQAPGTNFHVSCILKKSKMSALQVHDHMSNYSCLFCQER